MGNFPKLEAIDDFFALHDFNIPNEEIEAAAEVLFLIPFAMYTDSWAQLRANAPRWEDASPSQKKMCRMQARYVLLHYVKRIAETKQGPTPTSGAASEREQRRLRRQKRQRR